MRAYLFILVVAAAVTYLVTPLSRRVAERVRAMTPVRDRDVHAVPTPRLGGTAMLVGFAAAVGIAGQMPFLEPVFETRAPYGVLAGAVGVCLLGVVDDMWGLDAITKLAGQVLAAGVMAWQGVQLVSLPVAGVTVGSSGLFLFLTVLAVVLTINAVNFVDGLDGLAAGMVCIGGSAFFVYTYLLTRNSSPDDYSNLASLVTAALVGCCLGFLPHNFNPARVFMGDSGSMLIGLLLATSTIAVTGQVDPAVVGSQQIVPAFFPILLPVAVLVIPIVDLLLAVVRRTAAGQAPWKPDKRHLHHRLLEIGHSHARAVVIMYVWTATAAFGAASLAFVPVGTAVAIWVGGAAIALTLTFAPQLNGRAHRRL